MMNQIIFLLMFCSIATGAEKLVQIGPEQDRITVTCGDIGLLLRRETQWTPGRFDYRKQAMTTERSAYGTVFMFPEIGFIGTGHLENEQESLKFLEFFSDGKLIENPSDEIIGESFRFERKSKIRHFDLHNTIEVKNNLIVETARVSTEEVVPLKLIYHFMHAWDTGVSAYLAGIDSETDELIEGKLVDSEADKRKFFIQKSVNWVAIYHSENQQFAVSRLVEKPGGTSETSKIWNVPGAYRKYYLTSFYNQSVPAGFTGTWKMVTGFGAALPDEWRAAAKALANELSKPLP